MDLCRIGKSIHDQGPQKYHSPSRSFLTVINKFIIVLVKRKDKNKGEHSKAVGSRQSLY